MDRVLIPALETAVPAMKRAILPLVHKKFLRDGAPATIVDISHFPGAKQFFIQNKLTPWKFAAPVSQDIIDSVEMLSKSAYRVLCEGFVLFTTLQ